MSLPPPSSGPPPGEPLAELDLLLRLGTALLRCGAGNVDVEASLLACSRALGIADAEVSVTYTETRVTVVGVVGGRPLTTMRIVRTREPDYHRLAALHGLMCDVVDGHLDWAGADDQLRRILGERATYPRPVLTVAAGSLATAVAAQLGGGLLLCSVTFVVSMILDAIGRYITARNLSGFYVNLVGGALVAATASVLVAVDAPVRPPLVIAAGVVVLLPGIALVTTVQDALSGFMVTAAGRAMEVLVLGAGIVGGIASVLVIGKAVGITMPVISPLELDLASLPWRFVTAGVVAGALAIGMHAPARTVPVIVVFGGAGYLMFLSLNSLLDSPSLARAAAATAVGAAGQVYAAHHRFPALILAVPLITPMLPGLAVYSALLQFTEGDKSIGAATLLAAVTGALALALGVVLGQFLVQPAQRRMERLSRPYTGPRLLGPAN